MLLDSVMSKRRDSVGQLFSRRFHQRGALFSKQVVEF